MGGKAGPGAANFEGGTESVGAGIVGSKSRAVVHLGDDAVILASLGASSLRVAPNTTAALAVVHGAHVEQDFAEAYAMQSGADAELLAEMAHARDKHVTRNASTDTGAAATYGTLDNCAWPVRPCPSGRPGRAETRIGRRCERLQARVPAAASGRRARLQRTRAEPRSTTRGWRRARHRAPHSDSTGITKGGTADGRGSAAQAGARVPRQRGGYSGSYRRGTSGWGPAADRGGRREQVLERVLGPLGWDLVCKIQAEHRHALGAALHAARYRRAHAPVPAPLTGADQWLELERGYPDSVEGTAVDTAAARADGGLQLAEGAGASKYANVYSDPSAETWCVNFGSTRSEKSNYAPAGAYVHVVSHCSFPFVVEDPELDTLGARAEGRRVPSVVARARRTLGARARIIPGRRGNELPQGQHVRSRVEAERERKLSASRRRQRRALLLHQSEERGSSERGHCSCHRIQSVGGIEVDWVPVLPCHRDGCLRVQKQPRVGGIEVDWVPVHSYHCL
ncbi:hypothetical protein T492DRAFT_938464 [Pavlovales sp. CCMP2436]|nr:hypothetical protein T492DRAFT_938464 [Pavlovales sp. CCMP2436]